jgi:hypothetical protein
MYPLPRATIWRLAAPTRALGTFTAHAWYQLATGTRASALSFGAKLAYLAVAHHAEHAGATADGYQGSTVTDLAEFVGIPPADLRRPLRRLVRIGWLDEQPQGRYTPTGAAYTFIRGGESADATRVTCGRCLADLPAEDTTGERNERICDQCQPDQPAPQHDTRKE